MKATVDFPNTFSQQDPPLSKEDTFIVKMADDTTNALKTGLIRFLDGYTCGIPRYQEGSPEEIRAKSSMMSLVPAASVESIASIINAAWKIRLEMDSWNILEHIENIELRNIQKLRVLRDLSLKGLEVFEFDKRLEKNAA